MKISIIVNTHSAPDKLRSILNHLLEQTYKGFEVIIAEDGEDEATKTVVASFNNNTCFHLVHVTQENKGFRKTLILNKAIKASEGDYIIFLDGDCIPHKRFAQDHVALAQKGFFVQGRRAFIKEEAVPEVLAHGLHVFSLLFGRKLERPFKAFRYPFKKICINTKLKGVLGCNLGVWKKDIEAINGYNEAFEGWGREDSEFAARLYHLGLKRKLVYARAIVFHLNHPTLPRTMLEKNQKILDETLLNKSIRCKEGILKEL